jgi:hypothetical protein
VNRMARWLEENMGKYVEGSTIIWGRWEGGLCMGFLSMTFVRTDGNDWNSFMICPLYSWKSPLYPHKTLIASQSQSVCASWREEISSFCYESDMCHPACNQSLYRAVNSFNKLKSKTICHCASIIAKFWW